MLNNNEGIVFDTSLIVYYLNVNRKMIWYRKYGFGIVVWVGLWLFPTKAICQRVSTDSLLTKAFANDQLLPTLINAAQKFSPEIRRIGSSIDLAISNQKINKNSIYSGLSLQSSYYYGTNYSAVNALNNTNVLTTSQTGFYNIGIGLQLPITHIISRKHLIKSSQSQIDMVSAEKDNAEIFVRQEVIRLYQELKLAHRIMLISRVNRQAAEINYKMAEKDFLQGQITVEQNSRVLDIFNKAKIDYETFVNKFQTTIMMLDAYTGTSFSNLLNQVK